MMFVFSAEIPSHTGSRRRWKKNKRSKDLPDMTGSTPLILAAKNGSLEVSFFSGFPTKKSHSHFMYLTWIWWDTVTLWVPMR